MLMRSEPGDSESRHVENTAQGERRSERRADVRQDTVDLVVKMRTAHGEELCLVRNVSAGGLTAHVYSTLPLGTAATFEFPSGSMVAGRVLWQRDSLVGIQFDARTDTRGFLARVRGEAAPEARPPRVELDIRARARLGADHISVQLINISQGGAKLRVADQIAERQKLVLLVDGLPPLAGRVRWTRERDVGLAFYTPVPFEILAQWLPIIQQQITS